jgi:putative DNA primase/helicase
VSPREQLRTLAADLAETGISHDELCGVLLERATALCRNEPQIMPLAELEAIANEFVPDAAHAVLARTIADVERRRIRWFWPRYIPSGKITIFDGDPGLGKSMVTLDLAARATTGKLMPDGSPVIEGAVILLSAEDDPGDTIGPRLDAHGANPLRVVIFDVPTDDGVRPPLLPLDIPRIEGLVKRVGAVLVVIDPLMAYLGGEIDSYRDQDVRRAMHALAAMAARTGVAVLVVRHLNKGSATSGNPLYRGGGSIGIIASARAGLLVARDPDDPERRVLAVTKSNLGPPAPALGFRIETVDDVPRIGWLGQVERDASDLLVTEPLEERGAMAEAREWLSDFLLGGPQPANLVLQAGREAGHSERTMKRAKAALRVKSVHERFGSPWKWAIEGGHASSNGNLGTLGTVGGREEERRGEEGLECQEGQGKVLGGRLAPLDGETW